MEEYKELSFDVTNDNKLPLEDSLLFDSMLIDNKDNTNMGETLYQVQPLWETNICSIKSIGIGLDRPTVSIKKFSISGYKCELVSLLLNKSDIDEAEKKCFLPLLSLIFNKKNSVRFTITLEFHTFDHIKLKKSLDELINKGINISGFYGVYLKYYKNNELIKDKIDLINKICTKPNIAYLLVKYITHDKVKKLIINK
jgi:hypothetical protein